MVAVRRNGSTRSAGVLTALVVLMVSCGGGGVDPSDQAGGDTNGTSGADPAEVGDDWSQIVSSAREEGEVRLAIHTGGGFETFGAFAAERMRELYGIELIWTQTRISDLSTRVLTEQAADEYLWDVHQGPGGNVYESLAPAGALRELPPILDRLPESTRDESLWEPEFAWYVDEDNPVSLINYLALNTDVAVDRSQVGDEFTDAADMINLLDDEWQGRLLIYDPRSPRSGSLVATWFLGEDRRELWGDDYDGGEFLREIFGSQAQFVGDRELGTQYIAEGRVPMYWGADPDLLSEYQAQGLGQDVELLDFVQYSLTYVTSIFTNNPNPNATMVYLDWFLSPEGQEAWADATPTADSRRVDVTPDDGRLLADYSQSESYFPIAGSPSGTEAMNTVIDIAQQTVTN